MCCKSNIWLRRKKCLISIKPVTRQSFKQNYFSRDIEWVVFTDSLLIEHSMDKIYDLGPKICNPHRGDFTVLKAVRELRQSVLLDAFTRNFSLL